MADALVRIMQDSGEKWEDMLIFLPSRRAVRTVEKDLVRRVGHAVMLPHLVALGEGVDDEEYVPEITGDDVISNTERVIVVAKLLVADANIGRLSVALPIARDLVRMQDYLENEGVDPADIDWMKSMHNIFSPRHRCWGFCPRLCVNMPMGGKRLFRLEMQKFVTG